ncbi:MAG: hypothetical protein PHO85_01220 [Candidatus Cloacimonetes bacterium]|jgi:hypothetical protein|nr:hypothetical protein [Candidatus Cloacimonadota bacterium]MDD2505943.1 hypothetical protein [Candidatus Cloacimonadota bacterium]MDD4147122.1 hypothetical protein [Candidatus Cloacimonadota bacterium]MDD4559517.1 hypothetical protein [Candidatus Cloacimonadota bacterium]
MDYKDQETGLAPENPDYTSYESEELERLFESAETDSEVYKAIMDELSNRGYDFTPADTLIDISDDATLPKLEPLRYSIGGTRIWNIVALIVGIVGAFFFLRVQSSFSEVDASLRIMVYSMVLLLISLSYLISGIRLLANHKDPNNPLRAVFTFEYWFLAMLWFAFGAYEIFVAVKGFIMYWNMQLGLSISMYAVIPSIAMTLFSFMLGMAMLYLALELKVKQ